MEMGWGCSCCQARSWQEWLSWWISPSPDCHWSPANVPQIHLIKKKLNSQQKVRLNRKQPTVVREFGRYVHVCVCICVPSGMLTESCSLSEAPDVAGSAPGSPGDVKREEVEGSVQRGRSSVRTITYGLVPVLLFNEFHWKTIMKKGQFQETPAHPFHHSVPQVKGCVETNPQHSIRSRQK